LIADYSALIVDLARIVQGFYFENCVFANGMIYSINARLSGYAAWTTREIVLMHPAQVEKGNRVDI
jgi:hypothetical protein